MGDSAVANFENLPDRDLFATNDIFDDATDVEGLLLKLIGCALMCYSEPHKAGQFDKDKASHLSACAARRIEELTRRETNE
jgi:hypothetical protein